MLSLVSAVPKEKDHQCFKLRQGLAKSLVLSVQQMYNKELAIERCFGLLLCPGRNVKNSDMHLLDMVCTNRLVMPLMSHCLFYVLLTHVRTVVMEADVEGTGH